MSTKLPTSLARLTSVGLLAPGMPVYLIAVRLAGGVRAAAALVKSLPLGLALCIANGWSTQKSVSASAGGIHSHYPRYLTTRALACIAAPIPGVIWLSGVPVLLAPDPVYRRFIRPGLVHVPALVLAVAAIRRHWSAPFGPAATWERTH